MEESAQELYPKTGLFFPGNPGINGAPWGIGSWQGVLRIMPCFPGDFNLHCIITFGDLLSPEQIVQIVAVACEPPEKSARPISHWTSRELADEVKKRQIVTAISPRTVGRFLKRGSPPASPEPLLAQR